MFNKSFKAFLFISIFLLFLLGGFLKLTFLFELIIHPKEISSEPKTPKELGLEYEEVISLTEDKVSLKG